MTKKQGNLFNLSEKQMSLKIERKSLTLITTE